MLIQLYSWDNICHPIAISIFSFLFGVYPVRNSIPIILFSAPFIETHTVIMNDASGSPLNVRLSWEFRASHKWRSSDVLIFRKPSDTSCNLSHFSVTHDATNRRQIGQLSNENIKSRKNCIGKYPHSLGLESLGIFNFCFQFRGVSNYWDMISIKRKHACLCSMNPLEAGNLLTLAILGPSLV